LVGIGQLLPRLPYKRKGAGQWDRLWVYYLRVEGNVQLAELPQNYRLPESRDMMLQDLFIHCEPHDIRGKRVLELGSGLGWLAKRLAPFCQYVGVDWSSLAVRIARLHVPEVRFLHVSQVAKLWAPRHKVDTVVGRNFFIHQNFDSAVELLTFSRRVLRPRGYIFADFYWTDLPSLGNVVHRARSPRDTTNPSCGYLYDAEDICAVAQIARLKVAESWIDRERLRHFAVFTI
jgi:SAM-dependent methyltransferase